MLAQQQSAVYCLLNTATIAITVVDCQQSAASAGIAFSTSIRTLAIKAVALEAGSAIDSTCLLKLQMNSGLTSEM
jgi:hypothetical protein